jgi:ParB family chromosome partitioning protein
MDLDAINEATAGHTNTEGVSPFSELDINLVQPNPDQPRKSFENIEELAASIEENGLMQPIVVVERDGGYMIVSGERRYRATIYNQSRTIKAHVLDADDKAVAVMALVENVQREDLTPFEKAMYINDLLVHHSRADVAQKIGKPLSYVSKCLSVSKLNETILHHVRNTRDGIGLEILQELTGVKDEKKQLDLYLNKATRKEIREVKQEEKGNVPPAEKVDLKKENETLKKEVAELKTKQLYITGFHQKKGSHSGGGLRVRATNKNEAIELAKDHYDFGHDKNYVFEAETLDEINDSIENFKEKKSELFYEPYYDEDFCPKCKYPHYWLDNYNDEKMEITCPECSTSFHMAKNFKWNFHHECLSWETTLLKEKEIEEVPDV